MLFDGAEIDKASVVSFEILAIIFYGGRRGIMGASAWRHVTYHGARWTVIIFKIGRRDVARPRWLFCATRKNTSSGQIHWTHFSREECCSSSYGKMSTTTSRHMCAWSLLPPISPLVSSSRWFFHIYTLPLVWRFLMSLVALVIGKNRPQKEMRERELFYRDSSRVPCYRECLNSHGLSQCKKLRFLPRYSHHYILLFNI